MFISVIPGHREWPLRSYRHQYLPHLRGYASLATSLLQLQMLPSALCYPPKQEQCLIMSNPHSVRALKGKAALFYWCPDVWHGVWSTANAHLMHGEWAACGSVEGAWGFADSDYKLTLLLTSCRSWHAVRQLSVPHLPHLNNRKLCYSLGF